MPGDAHNIHNDTSRDVHGKPPVLVRNLTSCQKLLLHNDMPAMVSAAAVAVVAMFLLWQHLLVLLAAALATAAMTAATMTRIMVATGMEVTV